MSKKSKKKIKPSFTIELLDSEKKVAHERLGSYDTPSLYTYAEKYFCENGELFQLSGFTFFKATSTWILDCFEEEHELYKFALWASRNFPPQGQYFDRNKKPGRIHQALCWCRDPNSKWMVKDRSAFYAPHKTHGNGLDHEPTNSTRHFHSTWDTNEAQVATPSREAQISHEFDAAWRIARTAFRKELKRDTKRLEREALKVENTRKVRKTAAQMAVLLHIDKLTENLAAYKKLVEDSPETITQRRVREIFDDTNHMTKLNAELKKALGVR